MAETGEKEKSTASAQDNGAESSAGGKLPASYFQDLLDLPACKSKGCCDDCGKCER